VNERGEVVGILTFISLTEDETQAIQGFNFLVPTNIVREFSRTAGARLDAPSPFNAVWHDAVAKFARGDWSEARVTLDAAARLVPDVPDVRRLQAETELKLLQAKAWPSPPVLEGMAVVALVTIVGAGWVWRRRTRRHPSAADAMRAPEPEAAPPPVRISAAELAWALGQRTDLVIVDVREEDSYGRSSVQAKGAVRASTDDVREVCAGLARQQGIIVYCDSGGEALSVRAASRLMAAGYTRVAVLAGGFARWEAASLPLERTPHARGMAGGSHRSLPLPGASTQLQLNTDVNLPLGVKGTRPYFNARATRMGLAGLSLASEEPLAVGQCLRLTIFLTGEPLEIGGQVVSMGPGSADGKPWMADVAFEPLSEEQTTTLEGFILAQRTAKNMAQSAAKDDGEPWGPSLSPHPA
jgi:rhodanese-related sulfurtransferase